MELVKFLTAEFSDRPIFIVMITSVADANRDNCVVIRNKVAAEIVRSYGLDAIDLYEAIGIKNMVLHCDGSFISVMQA